jgi:hypothetical protein
MACMRLLLTEADFARTKSLYFDDIRNPLY